MCKVCNYLFKSFKNPSYQFCTHHRISISTTYYLFEERILCHFSQFHIKIIENIFVSLFLYIFNIYNNEFEILLNSAISLFNSNGGN